jgi:diguanylate cyclase (GGDEF)-like protein
MAIASLLCIFLIPGRNGALVAAAYYALNAVLLGVFFALNTMPMDPNLNEDLVLAYVVGHLFIVVMAVVFARLRVAYGRTLARAEDMEVMAMEDALTGILNRRAFSIAFKRARARSHRKHTPVSVLLIDIDHFKSINDDFGHDVGDHALRALAALLITDLRTTDEVFRCGGEEFLILLEETPLQPAWEIAERLRRKIRQSRLLHERTVTVSIGVAELGEYEGEMDIFKRADIALYEAKNRGRDQARLATPPVESATASLN